MWSLSIQNEPFWFWQEKGPRSWDLQIKVQRNRKQFWIPSWSFKNYGAANMQTKDNKYLLPRHLALLQRTALSRRSFNIRLPSLWSFQFYCFWRQPQVSASPPVSSLNHLWGAFAGSSGFISMEYLSPGRINWSGPSQSHNASARASYSSSPNTQPER